jgi:hypothetical protein
MVQTEDEPSARAQHTSNLGKRFIDSINVFEHQTTHNGIESCVVERE